VDDNNFWGSDGIAGNASRADHCEPEDKGVVDVIAKSKIALIILCIYHFSRLDIAVAGNRIYYGIAAGGILGGEYIGADAYGHKSAVGKISAVAELQFYVQLSVRFYGAIDGFNTELWLGATAALTTGDDHNGYGYQ